MQVYKNTNWTKRDYDITNIVAIKSDVCPTNDTYVVSSFDDLPKDIVSLHVETRFGVTTEFWGYA